MQIRKLYIDGYKNLHQCDYEFKNTNILIGANNTGKSNFLEVFSFLNSLFRGSEDEKKMLFEYGNGNKGKIFGPSNNIDINIEFDDCIDHKNYMYRYVLSVKGPTYGENTIKGNILRETFEYKEIGKTGKMRVGFTRNASGIVKELKLLINEKDSVIAVANKVDNMRDDLNEAIKLGIKNLLIIAQTPVLYSSPDAIRETLKDQASVIRYGRTVALNLISEIDKLLQDQGRAEQFKLILKDLVGIIDIKPLKIQEMIFAILISFEQQKNVNLNQLSDGTLMVINLIVYLMTRDYPIIAIEELENSIHPHLLGKVVEFILNGFGDKQIIMTTHSPILLQCVNKEFVSVIRANKQGLASIININEDKRFKMLLDNPFLEMQDIFNEIGEADGEKE